MRRALSPRYRWKRLPRAKRRLIGDAIVSGQVLHDPGDAALLVSFAPWLRREWQKERHPFRVLLRLTFLAAGLADLSWGISAGEWATVPVALVLSAVWLVLEVRTAVAVPRRLPQIERAESQHRDYLEALGHPFLEEVADVEKPFRWGLAGFALVVLSFGFILFVRELPLLDFGIAAGAADILALAAAVIGARGWWNARGSGRAFAPAALTLLGLAVTALWSDGILNTFFDVG